MKVNVSHYAIHQSERYSEVARGSSHERDIQSRHEASEDWHVGQKPPGSSTLMSSDPQGPDVITMSSYRRES